MKKLTMMLLGAASVLAIPAAASADWSAYVALTSDYRYRGISQNQKEIAEQGSVNYTNDGWYAGVWASKVNWDIGLGNPSVEVDIYGGKHIDLDGTDLNVEAYYYAYPDFNTFGVLPKASFYETIVQLSHGFGAVTTTVTGTWSPQFTLGSGDGFYVAGNASWAVTDWLAISGTVGHQWIELAPGSGYTHWDIGATATWKNLVFDARYVDTDIGTGACVGFYMPGFHNNCGGGFVGTVTYNIPNFPW
jgi:uncharacterized protein (TIGR02001 family)